MKNNESFTTEYDNLLRLISTTSKISNDIALLELEKMIKKTKVQELINSGQHKYAITYRKEGCLITSVYDSKTGKRKLIFGRTEEAFYSALYEWYFGQPNKATMNSLFEEWLQYRATYNVSPRTLKRYRDSYNKYLKGTILDTTPICKVSPQMVTDFFNSLISEKKLTDKQYGNIVVIPNKLFSYAVYQKIILESPMTHAMINTRACNHAHVAKTSDRIYYPQEKELFLSELQKRIAEDPRSDYLAIALLWKLGLRIGEVVAIKESDIDRDAAELHIQRMETRDDNDKPCIVDHCKCNSPYGDRWLYLSRYELSLLDHAIALNREKGFNDDGYVFLDKNGRRKSRAVDHWIRKICDAVNIPQKSAHDIRRTVASELFASGESLESIRDFLGHADIKTTADYIIDIRGKAERGNRFQSILSSNNIQLDTNIINFNRVQPCTTNIKAANP